MTKLTKLEAAKAECNRLWRLMCNAENVPSDSKFVVFTPNNPYSQLYNKAVHEFFRLRRHSTRAKMARAARRGAIDSLGMKEVRGALGGRYIE